MVFTSSVLLAIVARSAPAADRLAAPVFPNPMVTLNNGVVMPVLAIGTWQYNGSTAGKAIQLAFKMGITHVDDAYDYNNQPGVGAVLKSYPRKSYFLTTKVPPCHLPFGCAATTTKNIETDIEQLGVEYVDMMLLHGSDGSGTKPCSENDCAHDLQQYLAMEALYNQSKIKAIGVSNYCISCLKCLLPKVHVKPVVNQFEYHVGMGTDPSGLVSYCTANNIVSQAYSALGDGKLISDPLLQTIGKAHGVSSAQVALKWVVAQGHAVAFKSDTEEYIAEDIDLFSWNLTAAEMGQLSSATTPHSNPSWSCSA
jgi:diketogulonate reductase-like aldo/keto reductase